MSCPSTFSKRRAGPPDFTMRSAISVISRWALTGVDTRRRSPLGLEEGDVLAQVAELAGHTVGLRRLAVLGYRIVRTGAKGCQGRGVA